MAPYRRHIEIYAEHCLAYAVIPQARATAILLFAALLLYLPSRLNAQESAEIVAAHPGAQADTTPLQITLEDALKRARALNPAVQQAVANAKIAAEKLMQSRVANLPIVSANSQYLYTEGNGTPTARYIANNGVHEYIAQGDVHQSLSLANLIAFRESVAGTALSKDQTEIAQRGLMVAVVENYATLVAAKHKVATLQQAMQVAQNFLKTTRELEVGGEVAHADVVKAQIQSEDSQVALQDAQQACENARVALALMLFPNVNQNYEVVEEPAQTLSLPAFANAETAARLHNPALDAAFKAEHIAAEGVSAAKAEYLPTMTLDYFYGINANHFAVNTPSSLTTDPELYGRPIQNLGYSALASLTIPVWNWGATHRKVKSAEALQYKAVLDRQYAQRKLIAELEQFYGEAKAAKSAMGIRQSAAANAEESEKLTLLQYKAGNATALEVVTAEDALTLERNALANAQTRYAIALANLATLTGNL